MIIRPKLMGIGSALRAGYTAAQGHYILSTDADQSFSVSDMKRLHEKILEGYDLVIGMRHGEGGTYERNKLGVKIKYFISKTGNKIVRSLSGLPVKDFSVNFRILNKNTWNMLDTKENTN